MTLPLTGQHMGCGWEEAPEPASPPTLQDCHAGPGDTGASGSRFLLVCWTVRGSGTPQRLHLGWYQHPPHQQMHRERKGANLSGRVL